MSVVDENMRKRSHARRCKTEVARLLRNGEIETVNIVLETIVKMDSAVEEKFDLIDVHKLLRINYVNEVDLNQVCSSIETLTKYGELLLKGEENRPKEWRTIVLCEDIHSWNEVHGCNNILESFGYVEVGKGRWEYLESVIPEKEWISMVLAELYLLIIELDAFCNKTHANPGSVEVLLLTESSDNISPTMFKIRAKEARDRNKKKEDGNNNNIVSVEVIKQKTSDYSLTKYVPIMLQSVWKKISGTKKEDDDVKNEKVVSNQTPNHCEQNEHSRKVFNEVHSNYTQKQIVNEKRGEKVEECHQQNAPSTIAPDSGNSQDFCSKSNLNEKTFEDWHAFQSVSENSALEKSGVKSLNSQIKLSNDEELIGATCKDFDSNSEECVFTEVENSQSQDPDMVLKRAEARGAAVHDGQHCDLCGCSAPAVRCEKCSHQIFCLSCDDMYHRHPKRRSHDRKAVIPSMNPTTKPPLQKEHEHSRLNPVPPPRRKKSQKSVPSSPLFGRRASDNPPLPKKEFSFMDKMGSLRRMIGRPLPPVPKDEMPERPPKNLQNDIQSFQKPSSSCSSYSNVSDNEMSIEQMQLTPAYANEPEQSCYPSALNKSDSDSGIQMGFQGFPTLPKRGPYTNPFMDGQSSTLSNRMTNINSSSTCELSSQQINMQPMVPQTQSIQGLNFMHQMSPSAPGYPQDLYMHYPMLPPWMAPHPNYYPPPGPYTMPEHMKRTPSNLSINYPSLESGYRLNSYTSMGHLHNPMAIGPYPPYPQHQHRSTSPTHSTRSSRLHKTHSISGISGEVPPFPRSSRRATTHGYLTERRSVHDNTSSEEDYFSAGSDEEEYRSGSRGGKGDRGWQCEHCTYVNAANVKICEVCCKTTGHARGSSERKRRRRDGGGKSPGSGDSRPPSGAKGRNNCKTLEDTADLVDEIAKDLVNEMELNLNVKKEKKENAVVESSEEKIEKNLENGIKSEGTEPQRKTHVVSTGTSPPPQHISTQTNLSDDPSADELRSGPLYRTSSRSSITGPDREFGSSQMLRRAPSIQGSNFVGDQWPRSSRNSYYGGGTSRDPSPIRTYRGGGGDSELGSPYHERRYPYEQLNRTEYYLNLEELVERRRQEKMRSQGFELVRLLREAEQNNFNADDLQVAMSHCGNQNPIQWLHENWKNMVDTVVTLVTNYGRDKKENDIGVVSIMEAKESLRSHKGNIWAAVTDCVEIRQQKFAELQSRGDFSRAEIMAALTSNNGNLDAAYLDMSRNLVKPFQMKIWGPPVGVENESGTAFQLPYNVTNNSGTKKSEEESNRFNWIQNVEGDNGVGSVAEPSKKASQERVTTEFQPNISTPGRVNRIGSFSGGSYMQLGASQTSSATSKPEDTYVTVQWVSDNKETQKTVQNKPDTIYTTLQELTSISNSSPRKTEAKFPVDLDILETNIDTNTVDRNNSPNSLYTSLEELSLNEMLNSNQQDLNDLEESMQTIAQTLREELSPTMTDPVNVTTPIITSATLTFPSQMSPAVITLETTAMDFDEDKKGAEADVADLGKYQTTVTLANSPLEKNETPITLANSPFEMCQIPASVANAPIMLPVTSTIHSVSSSASIITMVAPSNVPPPPPIRTEASKKITNDLERRARMFLAEGIVTTYDQAEIAVKLIDLQFSESDAFAAARECSNIDKAISYLQQDCELCAGKYPMGKMVSMLNCIHRCCRDCACTYYSVQIRDRNIVEAVCPFCNEPDLMDDNIAAEYFTNLDIMLKNMVSEEIHELFQRKLRDRTLMKDPNFRWCSQCSSGFIAHENAVKLDCPDCRVITCAKCRKPWEGQHFGISCEQFTKWKEANDPEFQAKGLEKHLEENGIDCPSCKFRYSLAKGGCMHFRCLQCKFDFCSGCGHQFKMGPKCNFSQSCLKLGLHAHHPRNCLFYLRDKDPADLQKLLEANHVNFDTEPPPLSAAAQSDLAFFKCQVMEQKELPSGAMKDDICGNEIERGFAGLCRIHYIEYLVSLITKENVDPVSIFETNELQQELRRRGKRVPEQTRTQTDDAYRQFLCQIIKEQIPLDETQRR